MMIFNLMLNKVKIVRIKILCHLNSNKNNNKIIIIFKITKNNQKTI